MKKWFTKATITYNQFAHYNPFGEIGLVSVVLYALVYLLHFIDPFSTARTINYYFDHIWVPVTILIAVELLKVWDTERALAQHRDRNKEILD